MGKQRAGVKHLFIEEQLIKLIPQIIVLVNIIFGLIYGVAFEPVSETV
ncbi:Uncharacterised protein [Vibrio cholerae]|nr:Uncharacterised protein [Vibrio cholerae]CSD61669.1 Uncharacterised protein [Vibrio cholerae]